MIDIIFSKSPDELVFASLSLPASRLDILDVCGRLGVGDLSRTTIYIKPVNEIPNISSTLRCFGVNPQAFDQLNIFAARLETLTPQERFLLDGLCYMHGPDKTKRSLRRAVIIQFLRSRVLNMV